MARPDTGNIESPILDSNIQSGCGGKSETGRLQKLQNIACALAPLPNSMLLLKNIHWIGLLCVSPNTGPDWVVFGGLIWPRDGKLVFPALDHPGRYAVLIGILLSRDRDIIREFGGYRSFVDLY